MTADSSLDVVYDFYGERRELLALEQLEPG